jgi:hypothetical protein
LIATALPWAESQRHEEAVDTLPFKKPRGQQPRRQPASATTAAEPVQEAPTVSDQLPALKTRRRSAARSGSQEVAPMEAETVDLQKGPTREMEESLWRRGFKCVAGELDA